MDANKICTAQLDFWLADESWVRSCKGVRARTDIYFPSDHYIVEANFVGKLQGVVDKPKSTISSFRQPNTEEWQYYNQLLSTNLSGATGENWNEVATTIMHVAQQSLTTIRNFQKKSYISRRTRDSESHFGNRFLAAHASHPCLCRICSW